MQQLTTETLSVLKEQGASIPDYRLQANPPKIGIVHIGPGAFFRGHQAWYTHRALELQGGDWGICAVSMRSPGVSEALTPQDGLYALAELDAETSYEVIGAIQEVLIAGTQYEQVMARLSAESTKFVTLTITEKGYCLNTDGELDLTNKEIQQDLTGEKDPFTAVGMLTKALANRKAAGIAPLTIVSCDNLTDNGHKLRAAIIEFAKQSDSELATWLEAKLVCPCTMVDSITPATDDALRELISQELNVKDNWPIKRESFVQWVIENTLPEDAPAWEQAGATLTSDVRGFENAKLRLLNCPHSTMAYLGVLLGLETVHDAMQNPDLVSVLEKMIDEEVIPSFVAPKELDVQAYSRDILDRFRNPAIRHLVAQIAWDGSQKLPMRILPIIEQNIADSRSIKILSAAVVAWFLFLRKRKQEGVELVDPLADGLLAKVSDCTNDVANDIAILLSINEVFPTSLASSAVFKENLEAAYQTLLPLFTDGKLDWSALLSA